MSQENHTRTRHFLFSRWAIQPNDDIDVSIGSILIRFYGDQSSMFCKKSNIKPIEDDYDRRYRTLKQWGKQDKKRDQKATWALEDLDVSSDDCEAELQRMLQMQSSVLRDRNGDAVLCALCEEDGAQMRCRVCERHLHPLCLTPAALTPEDVPNDGQWLCPSCGEENRVRMGGCTQVPLMSDNGQMDGSFY